MQKVNLLVYIKRKWLFLLIVAGLIAANGWIWDKVIDDFANISFHPLQFMIKYSGIFRDVIYPFFDLLIKVSAGIFVVTYLYQREKKSKVKDILVEQYCELVDNYIGVVDSAIINLFHSLFDSINIALYTDDIIAEIEEEYLEYINIRGNFKNSREKLENFHKSIRKMKLGLQSDQIEKMVIQFEKYVDLFYFSNIGFDRVYSSNKLGDEQAGENLVAEDEYTKLSTRIIELISSYGKHNQTFSELIFNIDGTLLSFRRAIMDRISEQTAQLDIILNKLRKLVKNY